MTYWKRLLFLPTLIVLAACAPTPSATSAPDQGTAALDDPASAAYIEPFVPITRENAGEIARLGRLNVPTTESGSLFAWAFSLDGTRLVGLNQRQLVGWDLITGETLFFTARLESRHVFYSPDKTEVYTMDNDGLVRVFDGERGVEQTTFQSHPNYGEHVAYYPDAGWLAVNGGSGDVRVWDTVERRALVNLPVENAQINNLTFAADGTRLAVGSSDGAISIWTWETREQIAAFTTGDVAGAVVRLAFSPNGEQLAVATDEEIRLYAINDGAIQDILLTGSGGSLDVLTYTRDGRYLINSGTAESMLVWNPDEGALLAALPGVGEEPTAAAFSVDGALMLTSVFGRSLILWDLTTISDDGVVSAPLDSDTAVIDVGWSPDGRALALIGTDGSVEIWGIEEPPPPPTLTPVVSGGG